MTHSGAQDVLSESKPVKSGLCSTVAPAAIPASAAALVVVETYPAPTCIRNSYYMHHNTKPSGRIPSGPLVNKHVEESFRGAVPVATGQEDSGAQKSYRIDGSSDENTVSHLSAMLRCCSPLCKVAAGLKASIKVVKVTVQQHRKVLNAASQHNDRQEKRCIPV